LIALAGLGFGGAGGGGGKRHGAVVVARAERQWTGKG